MKQLCQTDSISCPFLPHGPSEMNDLPPVMFQNDKTEKKPEADGRHDEHIDGGNAVGVVPRVGEPPL